MNALLLAHAAPHYWSALLLAALISAAVSIAGYWQNARANRLDRQRQLFAEAFRSVMEYREFAYKVRRRPPNGDRSEISDALSEVQTHLSLHRATLEIESPSVAEHYVSLVDETRRIVGPLISRAWEQPPPASDTDMKIHRIDLTELQPYEAKYILACNRHLRGILRSRRPSRKDDYNISLEQQNEPQEASGNLTLDSMYEDSIDDSSGWRLMMTLFGKLGSGVLIAALGLGQWLSTTHSERLSTALGDMITPAAVMVSSAIAIAVWIAGPQRRPRTGKRVVHPNDLLGMAWMFSWFAIVGIGLAVTFRTMPPDTPVEILRPFGALSLALMGLVLVGLTRLILLSLRSISRRLPEAPSIGED